MFKLALAAYRLAEMVSNEEGPLDAFSSFRRRVEMKRSEHKAYGRAASAKGREIVTVTQKDGYRRWDSLHKLLKCPYCLGVWFAALLVAVPAPDLVVDWLAIAGLQHLIAESARRA